MWVPPGKAVDVHGVRLATGAVYVGQGLHNAQSPGAYNAGIEPALIDPSLTVDLSDSYAREYDLGYWVTYERMGPLARGAYLAWLARGYDFDPSADITFPFLFFYGLERRVLVDAKDNQDARAEMPVIARIVKHLRKTYANNSRSLNRYTAAFLEHISGQRAVSVNKPPPVEALKGVGGAEASVRKGIGHRVREGVPLDMHWALAWLRNAPEISLRTPALRCPVEFNQLFAKRFEQSHPDGLRIKANKTLLQEHYQPASPGIPPISRPVEIDGRPVPDAMILKRPTDILRGIADACQEDLGSYSRWVAKNPSELHSLPALALLPPELLRERQVRSVEAFIGRLDAVTQANGTGTLDAQELLRLWPTANPTRFAKPEAVKLFQLIESLGYGIEPDVRFGGPRIEAGRTTILFKLHPDAPSAPSPEYAEAATLLTLATEVSQADQASDAGDPHLEKLIESRFVLAAPERVRLRAHLRFLLSNQISKTGLKQRLAKLSRHDADAIGDLLIEVAAADGKVEPREVAILQRLFKTLGLDAQSLHSRLHTAATGGADSKPAASAKRQAPSGFALDPTRLRERQESTRRVAALLQDVFADDEPEPAVDARRKEDNGPLIAGLDGQHSALFLVLGEQEDWDRDDLAERARALRLLPDGAVDRLNEVAFERVDAPLLDGDENGYELDRETWEVMRNAEVA